MGVYILGKTQGEFFSVGNSSKQTQNVSILILGHLCNTAGNGKKSALETKATICQNNRWKKYGDHYLGWYYHTHPTLKCVIKLRTSISETPDFQSINSIMERSYKAGSYQPRHKRSYEPPFFTPRNGPSPMGLPGEDKPYLGAIAPFITGDNWPALWMER